MIGLDYIMAGHLMLASYDVQCKLKQTPSITVETEDGNISYDHTKTQRQLDSFQTDTISPYAKSARAHVGGLMNGEIAISQNSRVLKETFPAINTGCLYVSSIEVKIKSNPKIFIARDYPKDSCMYASVMEHERKHIEVDRVIAAKYRGVIKEGLNSQLKKIDYTYGPLKLGEVAAAQEKLQGFIQDSIKYYSSLMTAERRKKQQEIDSLQEYERVKAKCAGQQ